MSAFIVEDKTINIVITGLAYDRDGSWLKRKLSEAGYDLETLEGRTKLGWAMFSLNIRAVNQRYDDNSADQFRPLNFKFQLEGNYPKIAAFKALECWIYQCSEGDCNQSVLYKLMEDVAHSWACDIVSDMPEYETAKTWA